VLAAFTWCRAGCTVPPISPSHSVHPAEHASDPRSQGAASHVEPRPAGGQSTGQFAHPHAMMARCLPLDACGKYSTPHSGRTIKKRATRTQVTRMARYLGNGAALLLLRLAQLFCRTLQRRRLRFAGGNTLAEPRHVSQTLQTVCAAFQSSGTVPRVRPGEHGGRGG
jgi:hypothetical protein